jgi:hypothetical protein
MQILVKRRAIMRKSLWIILSLLVVAVAAPIAHADSFSVAFTCNDPCLTTPTAPPVTFPLPTTITVTWDGALFTISIPLVTGDLPTDTYQWSAAQELSGSGQEIMVFDITDERTGLIDGSTINILHTKFFDSDSGGLAFTAVAAPEPSSVGLMLLGIGLVFAMRKRRLSQAMFQNANLG